MTKWKDLNIPYLHYFHWIFRYWENNLELLALDEILVLIQLVFC